MADTKDGERKKKRDAEGIIEKIRRLITDDPDSDNPTGTGGRKRQRKIDDIVDEAIKGADEDNGVKR